MSYLSFNFNFVNDTTHLKNLQPREVAFYLIQTQSHKYRSVGEHGSCILGSLFISAYGLLELGGCGCCCFCKGAAIVATAAALGIGNIFFKLMSKVCVSGIETS